MVASGDVYVICHGSSDDAILAECDETYSYIFSNVIPEKRTRFPMMMYIKNNKFVTVKHGKYELKDVFAWIDSLGINA